MVIEKKIKVGDRVELVHMDDSMSKLEKGDKGTVIKIEGENGGILIWVDWDNGEKLALLGDIDRFKVIKGG